MSKVLLTGGAGYIGSHTIIELISANHDVVVIDNLVNSSPESLRRVQQITGQEIPFYQADVRDEKVLDEIFQTHHINAVIHFAGLKAVGESVVKPLEYYDNNLISTLALLKSMERHAIKQLIFSSSATVYGTPSELPLKETSRVGSDITNPYGQSKFMIEQIITDFARAHTDYSMTILRYFNPIGAHESGKIGEDPNGIPNNLLPYVAQVAVGKLEKVSVFGNDYDTPDGTGVRDYIHVVDLARGHVAALKNNQAGVNIYNLGTGRGVSVLEVIEAFSVACRQNIPYEIKPRRDGDIAACYADSSKAEKELGWKAEFDIKKACEDTWRWQSQNPNGYKA